MSKFKAVFQKLKVLTLKRHIRERVINIGREIAAAGRVLVLLPENEQRRRRLLDNSAVLVEAFPGSEICLVSVPDEKVRETARSEGFRSFAPHAMEINWYGFPKKNFFARISNLKSRMVVDLDLHRSCFNAAMCAVSSAPIRIGVFGSWGPPIHNVEIKPGDSGTEPDALHSLLRVLSKLTSASTN